MSCSEVQDHEKMSQVDDKTHTYNDRFIVRFTELHNQNLNTIYFEVSMSSYIEAFFSSNGHTATAFTHPVLTKDIEAMKKFGVKNRIVQPYLTNTDDFIIIREN